MGNPHSAVGLDARGPAGRTAAASPISARSAARFRRTHRWARVHRHQDELAAIAANEDKLAHVLFSAAPGDVGLYGKPMARNAQIWTDDFRLLLDGPRATAAELTRGGRAAGRRAACSATGSSIRPCKSAGTKSFGTARWSPISRRETGQPTLLADAAAGLSDRPRRRSAAGRPGRSSCGRGCWPGPTIKRPSACCWAAPSRTTTARC